MHVIRDKFKLLIFLTITLSLASCQNSGKGAANSEIKEKSTATPAPARAEQLPVIVAFGDSLASGYGLQEDQSFTVLLQRKLDQTGLRYRVVNAAIAGDTSAGGVRRIDWTLQQENVKFLILELGGNDGLRGLPVAELKKNLSRIIERAQERGVVVILAGMEAPPNLGEEYTRQFRQVYRDLAKKYKLSLIPFILEGVGGRPEFNLPDGIHPNAEGEKIMTENVWRVLEPLLTNQN
jgi:acyl-CoA thioesterase I